MAKDTKKAKLINAFIKLESAIEDLKSVSARDYVDYFGFLVANNDKLNFYKELFSEENLKLLKISKDDIDTRKADLKSIRKNNVKKAQEKKAEKTKAQKQ